MVCHAWCVVTLACHRCAGHGHVRASAAAHNRQRPAILSLQGMHLPATPFCSTLAQPRCRYPWIFLDDKPLDEKFRAATAATTRAPTQYGLVPREQWSYPPWVTPAAAAAARKRQARALPLNAHRHACGRGTASNRATT